MVQGIEGQWQTAANRMFWACLDEAKRAKGLDFAFEEAVALFGSLVMRGVMQQPEWAQCLLMGDGIGGDTIFGDDAIRRLLSNMAVERISA
jgi:hypothetical protein